MADRNKENRKNRDRNRDRNKNRNRNYRSENQSFSPEGKCLFCQGKNQPDYKKWEELKKFLTDRGKIYSRKKSGICSRHQRQLALAIKRDRFLALLPFSVRV